MTDPSHARLFRFGKFSRAIIPALILGTAVSQAAAERVRFWQEAKRFAQT
jgi:hypothetical protein